MDFKKLAEVELLDSAPEGATAFAEVNGEVKRVAGGIGGGGKGYIWDVTDRVRAVINGEDTNGNVDDENGTVTFSTTREEAMEVIEKAIESKGITAHLDFSPFDCDGEMYVSGTNTVWTTAFKTDEGINADIVFLSATPGASPPVQVVIAVSGDAALVMINIQALIILLSQGLSEVATYADN